MSAGPASRAFQRRPGESQAGRDRGSPHFKNGGWHAKQSNAWALRLAQDNKGDRNRELTTDSCDLTTKI
jgi:hypothetical protein